MTPAPSHLAFSAACDIAVDEFDDFISRRFAAQRTISVAMSDGGWFCAMLNGRLLCPPTPNLDTVIRFVRAFAIQTAGVVVDEASVERYRGSVRVPPETCRCGRLISTFDCPYCGDGFNARRRNASNVVPIRTPA